LSAAEGLERLSGQIERSYHKYALSIGIRYNNDPEQSPTKRAAQQHLGIAGASSRF
jgi:hypothetical protein